MHSFFLSLAAALLALAASVSPSLAAQDPAAARKAVEDFLYRQTKDLPGRVNIVVGPIDARSRLPPCEIPEVSLPPGGRAWGRTHVLLRCPSADSNWSQYVSAHVQIKGEYLVAARALSAGHVLGESDFAPQQGDLTDLPGSVITDPRLALGRTLLMPTAAGRPLRSDLLRQTPVIQAGQMVKIVSRGSGFQVSSEGQALNGAAPGQPIRVKAASGQTINGVARADGTVEVAY